MFKKLPSLVLAALCLNFASKARAQEPVKPLIIGDTIPEAVWKLPLKVINHPLDKSSVTLNDYRGKKLIIIDFWATWCGSCIAAMPKMAALQKQFSEDIAVINVTRESATKSLECLITNPFIKSLNGWSVVSDTLLNNLFPHRSIPHYIWIDQHGRFLSQSNSDAMLPENISKILNGNGPNWQEKKDIDKSKPLFMGDDLPKDVRLQNYSIFIEGSVSGLSTSIGRSFSGAVQHDQFYTNSSMLHMYSLIAGKLLAAKGINGPVQKRILLNISPADSLMGAKQIYTYQYICRNKPDSLYLYALQSLNMASGYHGRLSTRKTIHYKLVLKDSGDKLHTAGGKAENSLRNDALSLSNQPVSRLLDRLNSLDCIPYFVTDHTGLTGNIDLNLEGPVSDFQLLCKQLEAAGLALVQVEDRQLVFVLTKQL